MFVEGCKLKRERECECVSPNEQSTIFIFLEKELETVQCGFILFLVNTTKLREHQHVCGHLRKEEEEANNSAAHSDLICSSLQLAVLSATAKQMDPTILKESKFSVICRSNSASPISFLLSKLATVP